MSPVALFTANDGVDGVEVWKTDGTAGGTAVVAPVNPSTHLTFIDGVAYFNAPDGHSSLYGPEQQLWRTDGTAGGTYALGVASISFNDSVVTEMGGEIYYLGSNANYREALFASDGVHAGHFVAALNNSPSQSFNASFMGDANGKLLIEVSDYVWISDGTSGGTHLLSDGEMGSSLSSPSNAVAANGKLYFTADDGIHGTQFWQTDGTTATAVSNSIVGSVQSPLAVNGSLVFISGSSLETWDGTSASATVLLAGQVGLGNYEYFLQDGKLYFNSWNDAGAGLFVSDGTVAGTSEVAAGSYAAVAQLGGRYVLDGAGANGLYLSDGAGGAVLAQSGTVGSLVKAGARAYFTLNGNQLWVTDGTLAGTQLVKDGLYAGTLAALGADVVFTASTDGVNVEPWISDGTAAGTHQVADLAPALPGALNIGPEVTFGADLVFVASTAAAGPSLWVSDGTVAGTTALSTYLPINAGVDQLFAAGGKLYIDAFSNGYQILVTSNLAVAPTVLGGGDLDFGLAQYLTAFNGELFFYESYLGPTSVQRFGSAGLFATDGTDAGTVLISAAAVLAQPVVLGADLIFYGASGGADAGLFKSDGTAAGTTFLGALPTFMMPQTFTVAGARLFFTDGDATTGRELWVSDGAVGGAHLVKDIAPGAQDSGVGSLTAFGAGVVFTANDLTHGQQLWFSDGTSGGTIQLDINQTQDATTSLLISAATAFGGKAYFVGDDGSHGDQLWSTDGTTAGTKLVSELDPLHNDTDATFFSPLGGKLFFVDWGVPWVTDGTAAGTVQLTGAFNFIGSPTLLDGKVYFEGFQNSNLSSSDGIFVADGTSVQQINAFANGMQAAGDNLFFYGNDQVHGAGFYAYNAVSGTTTFLTGDSNYFNVGALGVSIGGEFFFSAAGPAGGGALWASNGAAAGTVQVATLPQDGVAFTDLTAVNGKLYFESFGADGGIWVSNGTVAGTHEIITVTVSNQSLAAAGTKLYYIATDTTHGTALWAYDTVAGTTAVVATGAQAAPPDPWDITPVGTGVYFVTTNAVNVDDLWHIDSAGHVVELTSPTNGELQPDGTLRPIAFAPLGTNLLFSGQDSVHGQGLFSTNGTTVTFLAAVDDASDFSVIGTKLYFQGSDATNGAELWVSDGTSAGTHRVTDTETSNGANISDFVTFGSKIYFSASDGVHGQELWSFNGVAGGAAMVVDIDPGPGGSNPMDLTVMGGALYFVAADSSSVQELWRTDGTSGGTHAITTAANGGHTASLFAVGSKLFFLGSDSAHGSGLFVSDGTSGGATFLEGFTSISDLTMSGGKLMFEGVNASGSELWTSDGTVAGTTKLTASGVDPGSGAGGYTVVGDAAPPLNDFDGDGRSDFVIENTGGAVFLGRVGGGSASYSRIAGLGPEWTFHGDGDFNGDGKADFLIQNTAGVVYFGEVGSGGQAAYSQIANLGPEWKFVGTGDFLGDGKADFLIENTSGSVYVGEVGSGGQAVYTSVANLGPEWKFVGAGDFLGDGKADFLIENTSGSVYVGEVSSGGHAVYTSVASLGPEWKFVGSGDFLADGKTGFLIENTSGSVYVGEVGLNHQATYTAIGALGPEWKFVGAGDYLGEGHSQILIENTAGVVVIGDVQANALHYTPIGSLGSEWAFH